MFIDFVTYLEIRDDLSEEDKQYINSEIKKKIWLSITWKKMGLNIM